VKLAGKIFMSSSLEVIIRANGFVLSLGRGNINEEVMGGEQDVGEALLAFCERNGTGIKSLSLFVSEDQVYSCSVSLPAKTPDIKEAISFQLGMLLPFPEGESFFSYSAERQDKNIQVTVFAVRSNVAVAVEELVEAGFTVKGLYPESQRYVTAGNKNNRWGLVFPGKLSKVFVFNGGRLNERFLCGSEDTGFDSLKELCKTEEIFHLDPPAGTSFNMASDLLTDRPLLKEYNMLPASFRRPDYMRMFIAVLLCLNLIALMALGGVKFFGQSRMIKNVDEEIASLMPLVQEVNAIKGAIRKSAEFLDLVAEIGGNPEFISFLEKLTDELPEEAYLDQIQLDAEQNSVSIQGFTDNVGELTEKLQVLGEPQLKSTSRRKNRTYFQVEISLP